MLLIAAPGQGSQKPGFLSPWLDDPARRSILEGWSEIVEVDLIRHGTVSDADTIRDTQIAQPLIVAAGLLCGRLLQSTLPENTPVAYAGHSVGEFTAAALSGVLSDEDALRLVAERGRAMAEASAHTPTGMSAVIGGSLDELAPLLESAGLYPANVNGGGQVVAAGPLDALARLRDTPPAGTRVIPLEVAGAFHTPFMSDAVEAVRQVASTLSPRDPVAPLYTNKDGSTVTDGAQMLELLVGQISSPVRWDRCMESFARDGVSHVVEVTPAGALVGLVKRALKDVATTKLDLPTDVTTFSV